MTQTIHQSSIGEGVRFWGIRDTKFKTMRISVHFLLPMQKETVSSNALLPFLLGRATEEYPDFTLLSRKLDDLYGAGLNTDTGKNGDAQIFSFSITGLSSKYAFSGETMDRELSVLLKNILFHPAFENGYFREEDILQEKRQICEMIDSDMNDKRLYAKRQCDYHMANGEPWGMHPYGTKESVQNVTKEDLRFAWMRMLSSAQVEILALGDCDTNLVENLFREAFSKIQRENVYRYSHTPFLRKTEVQYFKEDAEVAQSKLVMGFRSGVISGDPMMDAFKVMIGIFGGTPTSKLFMNVREKLSLCYYCSAGTNAAKGIVYVQSGVENKNIKRTEEEILHQLDVIKKGDFTEEEIASVKKSLLNSYSSLSDSLGSLENWYFSHALAGFSVSPQKAAEAVMNVTREEIIEAASKVVLDTVFCLNGNGGAEE